MPECTVLEFSPKNASKERVWKRACEELSHVLEAGLEAVLDEYRRGALQDYQNEIAAAYNLRNEGMLESVLFRLMNTMENFLAIPQEERPFDAVEEAAYESILSVSQRCLRVAREALGAFGGGSY